MSKKAQQSFSTTSTSSPSSYGPGLDSGGGFSPKLFARRTSKGGPFIISGSDSPYEKREAGQDYASIKQSSATKQAARNTPLVGLGIYSRSSSSRKAKKQRRIAAVAILVALFFLLNWYRVSRGRGGSTGQYDPRARSPASSKASSATSITGVWRRLWSPAADALSTPSNRREEDATHGTHTFHPNGLMLVNEGGRHPIHVLIESAEKKWRQLLRRQSSTLSQAVSEYKMRYKRNPPAGFEHWWNFAKHNKVVLVDEYDQIHRDFQPYWALEPNDMRHRNKVMQGRDHTFTLSIKDGRVSRHGVHKDLQRAKDMQDLLSQFSKWVPGEVNMTFIIDDQPAVMLGWNHKERMLEIARQGDYWGPSEFVEPENSELSNFAKACPPNSPLRQSELGGRVSHHGSAVGGRSFIHDLSKAVDLCNHPEFRHLHGHTATGGVPLTPLVPLFTWAKTGMHSDIIVTPLEQYDDDYLIYDPPFEYKTKNKLMWRGSTTGTEFRTDVNWRDSQRARLHFMAHEKDGKREIMWSDKGAIRLSNLTNKEINEAYMDISFSGVPAQCDPETCEVMEKVIDFAPTMGLEEQNQYRYLMDVDGNGWSGRFHRLLSTNGVVLKSTVFPEWYQDRIIPWVHYIPIKVDYSDVYDVMAFFVGTPDGQGSHDDMAKRIGEQGKEFAKRHWRRVDMAAYMFRLVLEYGRLLHQDQADEVDFYRLD